MNAFSSGGRAGSVAWRLGIWLAALGPWLIAASGPASAQDSWIWLDAQGRKVYSDLPPPQTLPDKQILQQPRRQPSPGTLPADDTRASVPTAAPAGDGKPAEVQLPAAERPLYQRNDETLRENCRRARAALQTLNSGLRLQTLNDKGEPVEMDATAREEEIRRMRQAERDSCVPETRNGRR